MNPTTSALLALVVAVIGGGGFVSLLRLRTDKDSRIVQTANELAASATNVATTLIAPLQGEIAVLRERVALLEHEANELRLARESWERREHELLMEIQKLQAQLANRRSTDKE